MRRGVPSSDRKHQWVSALRASPTPTSNGHETSRCFQLLNRHVSVYRSGPGKLRHSWFQIQTLKPELRQYRNGSVGKTGASRARWTRVTAWRDGERTAYSSNGLVGLIACNSPGADFDRIHEQHSTFIRPRDRMLPLVEDR